MLLRLLAICIPYFTMDSGNSQQTSETQKNPLDEFNKEIFIIMSQKNIDKPKKFLYIFDTLMLIILESSQEEIKKYGLKTIFKLWYNKLLKYWSKLQLSYHAPLTWEEIITVCKQTEKHRIMNGRSTLTIVDPIAGFASQISVLKVVAHMKNLPYYFYASDNHTTSTKPKKTNINKFLIMKTYKLSASEVCNGKYLGKDDLVFLLFYPPNDSHLCEGAVSQGKENGKLEDPGYIVVNNCKDNNNMIVAIDEGNNGMAGSEDYHNGREELNCVYSEKLTNCRMGMEERIWYYSGKNEGGSAFGSESEDEE